LLAGQQSLKWEREPKVVEPKYEQDDGPLTEEQIEQVKATAMRFNDPGEHPKDFDEKDVEEPPVEKPILEQHPYLTQGFPHFKDLTPMVHHPETNNDISEDFSDEHPTIKEAIKAWKLANPGQTIKDQRYRFARGEIDQLPWMLLIDNPEHAETDVSFGTDLPDQANKGDTFIRVDRVPNQVYKFNGSTWIAVDKNINDSYTYNEAYIDFLIKKISAGEYDTELLSDSEREQVATRLQQTNQ
jgi:hypothetical protein